jgi:hypothetical protein
VSTPPRGGYYAPLVAATPRNDDDPFNTDSGASDDDRAAGESPLLLTDPAEVVAAPADVMANLPATAGVPEDSGATSGVNLAAARDLTNDRVPPTHATPGTAAGVFADFALFLEKHVSALSERIDTLHAEVTSNHGHITKRLFPALEA